MHNFVVPEDVLWEKVATKPRNDLGTALNEAMIAIERANQPKFDGILTNKIDFNKSDELPREKLINLINHFRRQTFDHAHVSDDVFGNAYEHLIRNFASKAGKSSGEFYTPAEVASLMAEIIEPEEGQSVCDWASGSGGLLLQSRNYVRRHGGDPDRLLLYAQESNIATYNISRINMILHGVKGWTHEREDSIRVPLLLDEGNRLLKFDRVVMNPPFSLQDWGYDELVGGDPHQRFQFGMPPRDNGDYAWLQQVVASLKDDGRAIVVMSQGVLFRGQPEQTEENDGRKQKADAEWVIRHGFLEADLIECVIVLPSKLFYGNNVPACLVVLNKNKPPMRKGRLLMVWASRHFEKANPQNLLRPSDLMRILVPWRAYGDLEVARTLVPEHEAVLITREKAERDRRLRDIDDAYAPLLAGLTDMEAELVALEASPYAVWKASPNETHPFFGSLLGLVGGDKEAVRRATTAAKKAYADRIRELKRRIKELGKLQAERDHQDKEVADEFDREIEHLREASADLLRICSDPREASRYFALVERGEIEENEFNLNLPRYVNTFTRPPELLLTTAIQDLDGARKEADAALAELRSLLTATSRPHTEFDTTKWLHHPKSWERRPLRKLASIEAGFTKGRDLGNSNTLTVPYLTVVNVQDGYLDLTSVSETLLKLTEVPDGLLQVGDVLMTEGGDRDKLGRGAIWDGQIDQCAYQNHIFRVRLDNDLYRAKLFHYLIQAVDSKAYFYAHAKQTSNLCTINSRELGRFEVAVPEINEQDEMVQQLEAADRLVDAATRQRDAAERLKGSLLQNLLTGQVRVSEAADV